MTEKQGPAPYEERATAFKERASQLPFVVNSIIDNPDYHKSVSQKYDFTQVGVILHYGIMLPLHDAIITTTLDNITVKLNEPARPPEQRFAAALLADSFIQQTSLPHAARYYPTTEQRKERGIVSALNMLNPEPTVAQQLTRDRVTGQVTAALGHFVEDIDELFLFDEPTPEDIKTRLGVIEKFDDVRNTGLYAFHNDLRGSESTISALRDRLMMYAEDTLANSEAAQLLLTGEIDDVRVDLREQIWQNSFESNTNTAHGREEDPAIRDRITEYFFTHSDIHGKFWDRYASEPHEEETSSEQNFVTTVALHYPERIGELFSTLDSTSMNSAQRKTLVRHLVAGAALVHATLADDPEGDAVKRTLRSEIEKAALQASSRKTIATELEILADERPGFIVIEDLLARGILPRDGQTWDDVEETLKDKETAYISKKDWTQKRRVKEVKETEAPLQIVTTHSDILPHWPEARVPDIEEVDPLLDHLNNRLNGGVETDKKIDTLLKELQRQKGVKSGRAPAIIPAILPEGHPLKGLHNAGIDAIVPGAETNFSVILNADRGNLELDEGNRVLLEGEFDPQTNTAYILGQDEGSQSSINKALGTAVRLARTGFVEKTVKGNKVNSTVHDWEEERRRSDSSLPSLQFDGLARDPQAPTVLAFAEGTPVLLTIGNGSKK